eukprot:Blabericola_migrator_1__11046@NODE_6428_length_536_cov_53_944563_g4379_i0_p1_GENE_NODE_6428_length_536_cov_53_944563_g4379_i0NODE_6428_length_536_cov_53_944563_g4379_i0_p1_ORF_typecomplete_len130_score11_41Mur_ligase_C/PF02875_21/0_00043Trehalase/PF01204_18/0_31_NODE_6428_length_536_cov_53_944563_g4379_i073462
MGGEVVHKLIPQHKTRCKTSFCRAALGLLLKLPATLNYQLPNAMGRFQFVAETSRSQVPVFLDVGHNVSATERVAQLLKERFVGLEKIYAFVALSRKRAPAIFDPLFKVGAKMVREVCALEGVVRVFVS